MFQLTISVNMQNADIVNSLKGCILNKKVDRAVCVSRVVGDYAFISLGGEQGSKRQIIETVKDNLIKIYLTVVKKKYIEERLKLTYASDISKLLIVNMLVAFDRENEEALLRRELEIHNRFSVDGYMNFRMRELKERWTDICRLASENSQFLSDEATVNELLKFLISAVNPKIKMVEISQADGGFEVVEFIDESKPQSRKVFEGHEQLMLYLIDYAPARTVLKGLFNNKKLYERITFIFGAAENIL